jgi:hypothetical protein
VPILKRLLTVTISAIATAGLLSACTTTLSSTAANSTTTGARSPHASGQASTPRTAAAPNGQVLYGHVTFNPTTMSYTGLGGTIEPAYNDSTGTLIYLQSPTKTTARSGRFTVAPLYLPVYPTGAPISTADLNCSHLPADNCPDHGPTIAKVAATLEPGVYARGVLGHDHLAGIPSSGAATTMIWEPTVLAFTNSKAATQHITTLAQLMTLVRNGQAILRPLPQAEFQGSVVTAAAYAAGSHAPTIPQSH